VPVASEAEALEAVRAWFADRDSVDRAQAGEPDSPGSLGITVVACSLLDATVTRDTLKRHTRIQRVLALWLRGVQQDEEAVELALAAFKADVWNAWLDAGRLTGALQGATLEDTFAGLPDYQRRLSGEARAYPLVVAVPLSRPLP
jgi:hypothetical protein